MYQYSSDNMDQVDRLLKEFGLTSTETTIYRVGLAYTQVSVRELAKQTGIKRPTIYHALGTLGQKGLVSKTGTDARHEFVMTPPDQLGRLIDSKIDVLSKKKEALVGLGPIIAQTAAGERAQVQHFEGLEGVKQVVDHALYCQSKKWDIIAPKKNFFSEFDKDYAEYYLQTRARRKIIARTIWEHGLPVRRSLTMEEMALRNPRYLPENLDMPFRSVVILFDRSVAIISSYSTLSAILITSEEVAETFCVFFEGLWGISTPYNGEAQNTSAS